MSTLQVANLHFESTGNNRLQYTGSNGYNIIAGGVTAAVVNTSTFYANLNFDVAGTFKVNNADINPIGQQTMWIPAAAMTARTSNGAATGVIESSTNKVISKTFDFDTASNEHVQFVVQMPKSWNEGTLIPQYIWSHAATTTNFGVSWGIRAFALANGDVLDTAFGANSVVSHTGGSTNTIYISAEGPELTVAGLPTAEEYVVFEIFRQVANTGDSMAIDARLHGVKIHYTIDAARDD